MSEINQEDLRRLVEREVIYCVSHLVSMLASTAGALPARRSGLVSNVEELGALCEQAFELSCPIEDYEEAALQEGAKIFERAPGEWIVLDQPDTRLWDEIYESREDAARAFCEVHDLEPYQREVYEHWVVTEWFGRELEAHGEKVDFDFAGLTVWARTTTGQAIYTDSVIAEIYRGLR